MYNVYYYDEKVTRQPVSLKEARQMVKNLQSTSARYEKVAKTAAAPKATALYHEGEQVEWIEDRQNGWSLVHKHASRQFFILVPTFQLEVR